MGNNVQYGNNNNNNNNNINIINNGGDKAGLSGDARGDGSCND